MADICINLYHVAIYVANGHHDLYKMIKYVSLNFILKALVRPMVDSKGLVTLCT